MRDAPSRPEPLRILLVEDNRGDARLVEAYLEEGLGEPFTLEREERLEPALRRLREEPTDLVLLDLGLPDAGGLDALRRVGSAAESEPMVVVLTGLDDEETALEALREGAQDYLEKDSLDPPTLRRSIRYSRERKAAAEALEWARREAERDRERWATVFETVPVGLVVSDPRSERLYAMNEAFVAMFGAPEREMSGRTAVELGHWEDPERREEIVARVREEGEVEGEEAWFRTADGRRGRMRVACRRLELEGEDRLLWAVEDITEKREAEEALRESEERFRTLVEDSLDPITVTTPDGRFLEVNDAFLELFGYDRAELEALPVEELYADPADREAFLEAVAARGGVSDFDTEMVTKDGEVRACRITTTPHRGRDGKEERLQNIIRDVTQRKKLEEQLHQQALHDALTGLANRVLLGDRLEQAVGRARRSSTLLAVVMLDLVRFKRINDSLGHTAGDRVLEEVARRLKGCARQEDTVARWGGDEFVLLLNGLEEPEDLAAFQSRLFHTLDRPVQVAGQEVTMEVVGGAALFGTGEDGVTGGAEEPEDLIRYADQSLHGVKQQEGARFHVFQPTRDGSTGRMTVLEKEQDLRRGIEEGELEPFYQPIVRLEDGAVWGVEPLARWRHPERGLVPPGDFIPLAEETGLIHSLGREIVEQAIETVAGWSRELGEGIRVTPNVSGRQFESEGLTVYMAERLESSGLDPGQVVVEVTETSIMRATARLGELRELGVQVMVDDFGTGYSSLLYVRDLEVDGLKIDMSFVQGLGDGVGNTAIVETILTLGREMELRVVAEGIETEEQLGRLRELGCELGQGYFFARPMPTGEMAERLREESSF